MDLGLGLGADKDKNEAGFRGAGEVGMGLEKEGERQGLGTR